MVMKEDMGEAKFDVQRKKEGICLCHLPKDLLLIILSHLSVIDYLSMCGVCKCWRTTMLQCPVSIPQHEKQRQLPWFLLMRMEDFGKGPPNYIRPALYTTGKLGDLSTGRIYTSNMPELSGTQFLLSRHGWLLLYSFSSPSFLFFLNPISGARINLPFLDVSKLCSPVFDLSASPTSSSCMVFVISYAGKTAYEINTCRRGESGWMTNVYSYESHRHHLNPVAGVVFVRGMWFCLHDEGNFSVFDSGNRQCRNIKGVEQGLEGWDCATVSYVIKHGDHVCLHFHAGMSEAIALEEPLQVCKLCHRVELSDLEFLIRTSLKEAVVRTQDQLDLSSFNAHAWCVRFDSGNKMIFRWHHFSSYVNISSDFNAEVCYPCSCDLDCRMCPKENCTIVTWFNASWIPCSPDIDWMSG